MRAAAFQGYATQPIWPTIWSKKVCLSVMRTKLWHMQCVPAWRKNCDLSELPLAGLQTLTADL
jgi:hypothetical protein